MLHVFMVVNITLPLRLVRAESATILTRIIRVLLPFVTSKGIETVRAIEFLRTRATTITLNGRGWSFLLT